VKESPAFAAGTASRTGNVSVPAKFQQRALFRAYFHIGVMLMPSRPSGFLPLLPGQNDGAAAAQQGNLQGRFDRSNETSAPR
jgi:hypothetical protein